MSADPLAFLDDLPGERGESAGQDVVRVERSDLVTVAVAARDAGFEMFADLTAVDYLDRHPRFDVVINLLSLRHHRRLRLLVGVPGADPTCPTLTAAYPGANFFEREVYDLMGIEFTGHPDISRILMPDDWEGHPLRKDYAVGAVPVQFKSAPEEL